MSLSRLSPRGVPLGNSPGDFPWGARGRLYTASFLLDIRFTASICLFLPFVSQEIPRLFPGKKQTFTMVIFPHFPRDLPAVSPAFFGVPLGGSPGGISMGAPHGEAPMGPVAAATTLGDRSLGFSPWLLSHGSFPWGKCGNLLVFSWESARSVLNSGSESFDH